MSQLCESQGFRCHTHRKRPRAPAIVLPWPSDVKAEELKRLEPSRVPEGDRFHAQLTISGSLAEGSRLLKHRLLRPPEKKSHLSERFTRRPVPEYASAPPVSPDRLPHSQNTQASDIVR